MFASHLFLVAVGFLGFAGTALASSVQSRATDTESVLISHTNPLIFYHGRWDEAPETWWGGSGFKINVDNLRSLTLHLNENTTTPSVEIGVSLAYGPFIQYNVSAGVNEIPLNFTGSELTEAEASRSSTVVRINSQQWQNNHLGLDAIELNQGASLVPYKHSNLAFTFIGDSLSAGQYCPAGEDQAWPFLTGEHFKAEHTTIAQPGACLTDILSYGNDHGLVYLFFRTEDSGYENDPTHNYTTLWDFKKDVPAPTHIVIHIGANDASQNVTQADFQSTYLAFLQRLRTEHYPTQPIFVFTPWGWPSPTGPNSYYYSAPGPESAYLQIVDARHALGDQNVFLVNTTGWVDYDDVNPGNIHPSPAGHVKIAGLFGEWLEKWGLEPRASW